MELRKWQQECIDAAFNKYKSGAKHFLALATPGAGKTYMSSSLAEKLMKKDMIDLVICFTPSTIVANDFEQTLSMKLNAKLDGLLGSVGLASTYQNLQYIDESFWKLFKRFRVLVIFDEIHHCSGSSLQNANAWGERIIEHIQEQATYTIALTGTPWRSDKAPIVLSTYCIKTNKIICDYRYGLKEAIHDNVCRIPEIIAIDNDNISVSDNNNERFSYTSFLDLLSQEIFPYQEIIENDDVISQLLRRANIRLQEIRNKNHDAGGLIVAYSIEHAKKIQRILHETLAITAVVVTYREDEPTQIIRDYRHNTDEWIISVGMISEGTNIPRLQVCCHLTNIKTEMHFRQILGRILRCTNSIDQSASLFMPAEPKLVEYAYRVDKDIPSEADIVKFEKISVNFKAKLNNLEEQDSDKISETSNSASVPTTMLKLDENSFADSNHQSKNPLTTTYEKTVNIFGRFKQESLAIDLFKDPFLEKSPSPQGFDH
ncbi:MAG: DEAD/DEAH box helicase family protein [Endozoicomonadaceae bacterium]|nr:DEAD/DEAH box helicase family protein [Endozoicomonadaceae bacterium]